MATLLSVDAILAESPVLVTIEEIVADLLVQVEASTLEPVVVVPVVVVATPERLDAVQLALVASLSGMATQIAVSVWRSLPSSVELDELRSIAYMGLVTAASRWPAYCERNGYNPEATEYFTPYAQRRIRGAIMDSMRANDWARRTLRDRQKLIRDQPVGSTDAELARGSGLSVKEVRTTRAGLEARPVSIDAGPFEHATEADTEDTVFEQAVRRVTVDTCQAMDRIHQVVIVLRYYIGMELQEIAALLGVTDSRASHIHTEAVLDIHQALKDAVRVSR